MFVYSMCFATSRSFLGFGPSAPVIVSPVGSVIDGHASVTQTINMDTWVDLLWSKKIPVLWSSFGTNLPNLGP